MEWIIAKENPPKNGQKNILCSGVDGGVYKPSSVIINDEGDIFAIVSGQKRLIYAYLVYPDAPKQKRVRMAKEKNHIKRRASRLKWPLNMFYDIDEESFCGCILLNKIPEKFDNHWNETSTKLTEREKSFLEMYYMDLRTLREIATISDLSVERTRQIIYKAIRKLRYPTIIDCLLGKTEKNKNEEMVYDTELKSEILEQDIAWCDPQLSVRAFNALKRNGINKKRELLLLSAEEVKKLRNVGKTTEKEIAECKENIAIQVGLKKPIIRDKIVP